MCVAPPSHCYGLGSFGDDRRDGRRVRNHDDVLRALHDDGSLRDCSLRHERQGGRWNVLVFGTVDEP